MLTLPLALLALSAQADPSREAPVDMTALQAACEATEARTERSAADLHNIATCFYRGAGRLRDHVRARALYRQAADQGSPQSLCALGNMLVEGQGGDQDVAGGVALCRRAAEAGFAPAQTDYANFLLAGRGVARSVTEARRWYQRAAEQRQPNAAFVLGQIYLNGDGVDKNNAEAARWWRVAHEGGRPDAAYMLALEAFVRVARSGSPERVSPAVLAEAMQWFELAAANDPASQHRADAAQKLAQLRQFQTLLEQARRR